MQQDTGPSIEGMQPAKDITPPADTPKQQTRSIVVNDDDAAERAEFERVLADIADRLSNIVEGQFDQVITGCLRQLVESLGFDRSTLMAFSERGHRFQVTHSWAIEGIPAASKDAPLNEQVPWFTHQLRSGHIVSVSSSIDLPTVAAQERAYLLHSGLKSALAIPLLMEGMIIGALSFGSFRSQRQWSLGLVSSLRLAAEIMALGIRRHQYAQGLKNIAQAMDGISLDRAAPGKTTADHFRRRAVKLLQAENHERRHMGQVLHEDVMQILSAVGMLVQSGENGLSQSPAGAKAVALLKDALQKLRQLTLELRPEGVFDMTLADGIQWLADQVRRRYGLDVDVRITGTVDPVSDDVRSFLYDSARKLLENVAVHASCKQATVEIQRSDPNYIQLTVSDEGVGFNPARPQHIPGGAFGLFSIREQLELLGGTMEVHSSPGKGTSVVLTVSLAETEHCSTISCKE